MSKSYYNNLNKQPGNNFTTGRNNDIIDIYNTLKEISGRNKQNNSDAKTAVTNIVGTWGGIRGEGNGIKRQPGLNRPEHNKPGYKPFPHKPEPKPFPRRPSGHDKGIIKGKPYRPYPSYEDGIRKLPYIPREDGKVEPIKLPDKSFGDNKLKPIPFHIPKEKKEQDRLKRATGGYNLEKVDSEKLDKHLLLKEKTPDDYYSLSVPHKELNKRLDNEAFGPKTDFSVWNFENNFDKLNKEEQSMLIHKMQLALNNEGYKDYNGYSLKTDGIFGDKTKSVYEKYKKDKKDELEDYEPDGKKIVEGKDYNVLKDSNGKPVLLANTDMSAEIKLLSNSDNKMMYFPLDDLENEKFYPMNIVTNDQQLLSELKEKGFSPEEDTLQETIKKRSDYLIKENKNNIIDAANEFGVNPGILGAIIYTEQFNNVNMLDYYFDDFGGKLGLDTSIGLAQVKISTAKMLEEEGYMPRITVSDNERKTENAKRIEALNDPQTNIRYAAAYLKYIQDIWKDVYPEIDGRTAILATLYNTGAYGEEGPRSNPKPNDFGRYAKGKYYDVVELLGI